MEITKAVKPVIRRGANTFGNIAYLCWRVTYGLNTLRARLMTEVSGVYQSDSQTRGFNDQALLMQNND